MKKTTAPVCLLLLLSALTAGGLSWLCVPGPEAPAWPPGWPVFYLAAAAGGAWAWRKGNGDPWEAVRLCGLLPWMGLLWHGAFFLGRGTAVPALWLTVLWVTALAAALSCFRLRRAAGLVQLPGLFWLVWVCWHSWAALLSTA